MSMSANIIREIVSSVLKVRSNDVKLSGEISLNKQCNNWEGNSLDRRYDYTTIYGFTPEKGLVELPTLSNIGEYTQEAPTFGDILEAYPQEYKDCIFFVIKEEGCNQMQNPQPEDYYENLTLYKAPNMERYLKEVEKKEALRWAKWINN